MTLMASERTFTEPWDLSDVSFVVEGRYIYANKIIMSMWSPVLKAMFGGGFRESDADVVELPGKLFDDLLELVCVLHPPNKPIDGKLSHIRSSVSVVGKKQKKLERQIGYVLFDA